MAVTVRKEKWQGRGPRKELRGKALNPNIASQARYYDQLRALIRRMSADTLEALDNFFKTPHAIMYFAQDASVAEQARVLTNELAARFDQIFTLAAKPMARRVATEASQSSASALEGSLKQLSNGLTIETDFITGEMHDILSATVTENVGLIKSIPSDYISPRSRVP